MLDFSRYEVLTFDCYGTLINWEAGILAALHRVRSAHGKKMDDATLLKLYGDFEQHSEQGKFRPYREVLESVVLQFANELKFTPTAEQVRSLPDSLPTWKPWPDTVAALRQLKTRFRLAILSNVDDDLFAETRPKLFELALSRIQAPAHRVLHVGQSIYHDVIPAQALGLATVWVNRPSARPGVGAVKSAEAKPDLTVTSLAELAAAAVRD